MSLPKLITLPSIIQPLIILLFQSGVENNQILPNSIDLQ